MEIDYTRDREISLDFFKRTLVVNKDMNTCKDESSSVSVDLEGSGLSEVEIEKFKEFLVDFREVFLDKTGLTHVAWHKINIGSAAFAAGKSYCYDKVKQSIIDYHIKKMLADDIIMPIESAFASPNVLHRKNNDKSIDDPETWRFTIYYGKLNAITH